ncbi:lipocalin family protein [Marinobacter sp.]
MIAGLIGLSGCTGLPEGIEPVSGFESDRYLGTWYEIARLDHSFERGLSNVRAEYSRNDDGSIKVINRGYNAEEGQWEEADGRAVFVEDKNTGHLKVSFFGPFYASYVVFELDKEEYSYAYVTGYNRDYLWFLSRAPEVSKEAIDAFKKRVAAEGFDLDELIIVEQEKSGL